MRLVLPYPVSANRGPAVYQITDAATGRFYIGSSVDVAKRWKHHVYRLTRGDHPNPILQAIWNANPKRLELSIVEAVPVATRAAILAAEQVALDAARVGLNRQCLNVLPIAGSHLGRKRSEQTRMRLAAANTGKKASDATRAKQRAAKLGKPLSEAHRKKLGDLARGRAINRPKGLYRYSQRRLTADQVVALRAKRASGASWRVLALGVGMAIGPVKRAVLGITYPEVGK